MKTILIKDMDSEETKKRIYNYLKKIDSEVYPSEIAKQLHIDYNQCVEIIEELLKEGEIEIVED